MKKIPSDIVPLSLVLVSIMVVFNVSRIISYLVLETKHLPAGLFADLNDFRLHHFVYGNVLIVVTGFMSVVLGVNKHKYTLAALYGIGLGLVLDEFLLWMGHVEQLQSNVLWIPHSFTAVMSALIIIACLIVYRLYIHPTVMSDSREK